MSEGSERPRPFRFGVQASGRSGHREWTELARTVESLGYAALTMPDHFGDQLAPVPALQAAADATTTLRIGALVHDNDYKHPVVLAKELATLDVLSDGRLEIGLGAGWLVDDYEQAGIAYDPPGVRVDRFAEGLAVVAGCLGPGPFSFAGEHYSIAGYDGRPKPVQQPRPPVLIGGGGPRVLRLAAREADIVGINGTLTSGATDAATLASMTAAAVDAKVGLVRDAAAAAGRAGAIEMNIRAFAVAVTDDRDGVLDGLAQATGRPPAEVAESPFVLVGDPARIADDLLARRDRWGFSYVVVGQDDVDAFAPVVAALAGR